jgi:Spy/CpxP family protein refolding chaperone
MNLKQAVIAGAIALGVVGATAYAHGYGPGMMGGYGGYGMGPGMMGGYGMGPGMMGGYDGYGMGPNMMGGFQFGTIERLDLTAEQRQQLDKIEGDLRRKNWALMGKMHDEMDELYDPATTSGGSDRDAILAANRRMSELRQQMLENSLDATDKAQALLTPQQREQYQRLARAWRDGDRN